MTKKTRSMTPSGHAKSVRKGGRGFTRVVAVVVALEEYRKPSNGAALPKVDYACNDADAFADVIGAMFPDMPADNLDIKLFKNGEATLVGLQDDVRYAIRGLETDDLFVFYYAGHGFHGAGGNRLSVYDTVRDNINGTSFSLRDDLLDPLSESACERSLIFVDACASKFRDIVSSRDAITDLSAEEVEEFLDDAWYCGVFLSCSPGEQSYPSAFHEHGIWTYFLLEALSGRADHALTRERWLTDAGLRDYLKKEVPRYLTQETKVRGRQTPQAIISSSSTFSICQFEAPPASPPEAMLAGIKLLNDSEFLEGTETDSVRSLSGFDRKMHKVPNNATVSAASWYQRLLKDDIEEDVQEAYRRTLDALGLRRSEVQKIVDLEGGDLATPFFRYSIEPGQSAEDPGEYYIRRQLALRPGWEEHRDAIDGIFGSYFDRVVIDLKRAGYSFDDLVDELENVKSAHGGSVKDDDRKKRVTYERDGASFTFDLHVNRLEISFNRYGTLDLVDAARQFQLGIDQSSPMLSSSKPISTKRIRSE